MHAPATDNILRWRFRMIGLVLTIGCGCLTAMFGLSMAKSLLVSGILTAVLIGADLGNAYTWPYVLRKFNAGHYGDAIFGSMIGALIMAVLRNGSQQMGWPTYFQEIIIGAVIIACPFA